jgi:hypothetical protein
MTHDQKESEKKGKALQDEREELKAKVQEVNQRRDRHKAPEGSEAHQVPRPAPDDPRYGRPSTQADQKNLPTGGTSGASMGGSANRKKDHAG